MAYSVTLWFIKDIMYVAPSPRTQRSTKLSGKTLKFLYDDQSTCPKETVIIVFAVPIVCLDTIQNKKSFSLAEQ